MSHLRRTPAELKQFNKLKAEYISEGYPEWYAVQMCWDILHTERAIKRGTFRSKVSA